MAKKAKAKTKAEKPEATDEIEQAPAKKGKDKAKKIKKAEKSGKTAGAAFDITAAIPPAPIYLYGHVAVNEDGSVTVNHKKPRSSKRIERMFSAEQVCGYSEGSEGDGAFVLVVSQDTVVDDTFQNVRVKGNKVMATDGRGRACVYFTNRPGFDVKVARITD